MIYSSSEDEEEEADIAIFKWGDDGTKTTNISVTFHRSFTMMM